MHLSCQFQTLTFVHAHVTMAVCNTTLTEEIGKTEWAA